MIVADWIANQPEILTVLHPAFPTCPGHEFWKRDFTGSSGLFSVLLKESSDEAVAAMIDGLEYFALGGSWGGYESLIWKTQLTRSVTNWNMATPCIRFHIGLEDPKDLIEDLRRSLKHIK